ncbi:AMP-binding protein, partial [Mesorhizobium mediterraneum]|uniref:AMP-binding protein n=1 Tax=Mesorhizobium mediterraneum TaxID=43617 RepID=UPI001783A6B2
AGRALPASIRRCITGGEAIEPAVVSQWRSMTRGARLFNAYGPTETTVTASVCEMTHAGCEAASIGRPLTGSTMILFDRHFRMVPAGAIGELFIGGLGVARGYGNRPDLTAERFIPDPCGETPGGRLYRTGDRARIGNDGDFEFLSRSDRQVKIRGFRLELDEIERTLEAQPGVSEAAVAMLEQDLVAWISVADPAAATDLGSALRESLPAHMIPRHIERVDALPRTS